MLSTPKTILVTGASQGIGYALAVQLAQAGHTVIAWARDETKLVALKHAQPSVFITVVDLADTGSLAARVGELLAAHPALSGVIHNAAIQIETPVASPAYPINGVAQEIAINLTAPIVLSQLLLQHFLAQDSVLNSAFICNISSVLALAPKRSSAVYCASKAGLHGFSQSLRAQLAGTAVKVIEIMPPTVATQMTAHRSVPKMQPEQVARQTIAAIQAGKPLTLLGLAKVLGVLRYIAPPIAKKIMLKA